MPFPQWTQLFPFDRVVLENRSLFNPLGERLGPCHALFLLADRDVHQHWMGRSQPKNQRGGDIVLLTVWYRMRSVFRNVLQALRHGESDVALMLCRPLFEAMLDLYWVAENREHALPSLQAHRSFHLRVRRETAGAGEALRLRDDVEPFRDRNERNDLRKRYGSSWTGESVWSRVKRWSASEDPEPFFPELQPGELRDHYEHLVAQANLLVHGSSDAMRGRVTPVGHGDLTATHFSTTPVVTWINEALLLGYWAYDRAARLMYRERDIPDRPLDRMFMRYAAASVPLRSDVARKAGRNDACPCNASVTTVRKFKHCHGRPSISSDELSAALGELAMRPFGGFEEIIDRD